jgi:hypothetical protein
MNGETMEPLKVADRQFRSIMAVVKHVLINMKTGLTLVLSFVT